MIDITVKGNLTGPRELVTYILCSKEVWKRVNENESEYKENWKDIDPFRICHRVKYFKAYIIYSEKDDAACYYTE